MLKNLSKFIGLLTLLTISSMFFSSGKAHAATIDVSSGCNLNNAIDSVNGALDSGGCSSVGPYGIDDTINLPAGTTTLTADITGATSSSNLTISGAGVSSTTLDANGHRGFNLYSAKNEVTIQNMKVINATAFAFNISNVIDLTIKNIEVANSVAGIHATAVHATLENVFAHDNINVTNNLFAGIDVTIDAINDTDIPSIDISDSKVNNNSGLEFAGLLVYIQNHTAASVNTRVVRTSVQGNISQVGSGLTITTENPTINDLNIDAVTVSNNSVVPLVAGSDPSPISIFYVSGFSLKVSNLSDRLNVTNVTVANNSTINTVDDHISVAGFFGLLIMAPRKISFVNISVVGNSVEQSTLSGVGRLPAFFLFNVQFDGNGPTGVLPGGTAQNSLVAHNNFNGTSSNCMDNASFPFLGLFDYDITPANLGNNISDDQTCTGYRYAPNLYETIDHYVADNGGPVPTLALLPGSPAIGIAGQVLGISTDARGIARPSTPDAGAYQTVLGTSTTTPSNNFSGVTVPNTGFDKSVETFSVIRFAEVLAALFCALFICRTLKNAK